jgi:hypothetical protein
VLFPDAEFPRITISFADPELPPAVVPAVT